MFTGIVQHLGRVRAVEPDPRGGVRLTIFAPTAAAERPQPSDSISINGICLTLVACDADVLRFDAVPETLSRSNLGLLRTGDPVNVELSLRVGDRLGGHFVYGHIDTTAAVLGRSAEGQGFRLVVDLPQSVARFVVEKGCIALDGVSLTVADVGVDRFEVAIIPETASRTTLGSKVAGALLNLEVDPLARYALSGIEEYEGSGDTVRSDELAWAYEI
jgi:riboflavin synthase